MLSLPTKAIQRYAHFLGGITSIASLAVVLVWVFGLMTFTERVFMTSTVFLTALLVWVLLEWAKQIEYDEQREGARTSD